MDERAARALLAAGVVALLVAAILFVRERKLLLSGALTHGDVVAMQSHKIAGEQLWAPVVRFPADGAMHVFTGRVSSLRYEVGDGVEVLYEPQNPEHATLDDPLSLALPAIAAFGLAVVLAGVGAVLLFALRE